MIPGFDHIDTWVFDLDNTLYPPSTRLFELIDRRMTHFIADRLGIDGLSAFALQKQYYRHYGTTLRGLMTVEGVDPHEFLAFVHDIPHDRLTADPALGEAIANLPGRRFVLTNGSRGHAERCAEALGLHHLFEDFFDIAAADFVPKPDRSTYERFVARFAIDPSRAAMFEDLAGNLREPHALGMRTVLVLPRGADAPERAREAEDSLKGPHVDHVTDDLTGFLAGLIPAPGDVP
ncbi:MAG TPA: pyrimidine 5'-nucleotidase [Hyphomicrobiales bacterium]|nr:pyrimidine 5'-nucleotidase [Hyphomicrobiales bacterium]